MSNSFELHAEPRTDLGSGASRRLRQANKVPAVVYGANKAPQAVAIGHNELAHALENEAFYSHILSLKTGEGEERVVLKDLQRHPSKPKILHVDLQRVSEKQKLHMHIPLHFVGDEVAPGVKEGGIVTHHMIDIEVTCLPKDLPEYIEVDVSGLGLNESVHLSEVALPAGVEIVGLSQGPEYDLSVASIHHARAAKEEEEEGAAGEGETGAEAEGGTA